MRLSASGQEQRLALPYPSGNGWILEQVATWLVLGPVPDITHGLLSRADVVQGSEHLRRRGYTVAHYYTVGERPFFADLAA
ncbi:MAG: hypothetical protein JO168_24395 [Solirubrobacterales bacterium]|nr:hypothetical protein [Solirubrobacterales bacterium]